MFPIKKISEISFVRDGRDSLAAVSLAYPNARRHLRSSPDNDAFIISECEICFKIDQRILEILALRIDIC